MRGYKWEETRNLNNDKFTLNIFHNFAYRVHSVRDRAIKFPIYG